MILFIHQSYIIGLWFTLRTHAALVWQTSHHSHTYVYNTNPQSAPIKKFVSSQIQQLIPNSHTNSPHQQQLNNVYSTPTTSLVPQRPMSAPSSSSNIPEHNIHDLAHVTTTLSSQNQQPQIQIRFAHEPEEEEPSGHDSPNWGKTKSGIVLVTCTALYSIIAEILVQN